MQKAWEEIIRYWKNFERVSFDSLNAGASPEELLILESYIGQTLSTKFKDFYEIHNGWGEFIILPHPSKLLSTEEILERWSSLNSIYNNELYDEELNDYQPNFGSDEVKKERWNPGWIPYTQCSRGRDFYCLDFDPTSAGEKGQVMFYSIDVGERLFVAGSFEQWIDDYIDTLSKGLCPRRWQHI